MLDRVKELEALANRETPVLGADAAAAHTRRGYGYICPDELGYVWTALEEWVEAKRPQPRLETLIGQARHPYARLITALTTYQLACERSLGLRR